MIGIWREILQVPDIGPTSNFFELGGHSLMAMRLVTKVARIFDVKINVMSLFQTPTVREFAARVSGGLVSRSKLGISSKFSHSVIRRPSSP
jgi:acyl carrier protein